MNKKITLTMKVKVPFINLQGQWQIMIVKKNSMIGFTDPDSESRPSVAIQLVVFAVEVRDDQSKKTV